MARVGCEECASQFMNHYMEIGRVVQECSHAYKTADRTADRTAHNTTKKIPSFNPSLFHPTENAPSLSTKNST